MQTILTPPTLSVPRPCGRRLAAVACLLASVALGACRDAPTDPMVGLVAEEAGGALAMGVRLPDPSLWGNAVADGEAQRAAEAWERSWDLPLAEARRIRASAYPALARGLAGSVPTDEVNREIEAVGEGVRRAQSLNEVNLPVYVSEGLREASTWHAAAVAAARTGDHEALLDALLRGGDALREVGPEAVARDLVARVEASFGRVSADDPYSEQDLERIRRLILGGRQAVDDGDWVLAIRRAYYAKGLMIGTDGAPS